MPLRLRTHARYGDPVQLNAQFYSGGVLFDPVVIERVEIWQGGEGTANGGVLVDVIDPINIIQTAVGQYHVIVDMINGSPHSPAAHQLVPNQQYFDRWIIRESVGGPEVPSVGLNFYLYPAGTFIADDSTKFRFEMKLDRKRIVKGENLDIRLQIIPVPLYRSRRDPIVDYLLPISTMRVRLIDTSGNQIFDWTSILFTGKEGVLPTSLLPSTLQLGEYRLIAELSLPNGQTVRYPYTPLMLID